MNTNTLTPRKNKTMLLCLLGTLCTSLSAMTITLHNNSPWKVVVHCSLLRLPEGWFQPTLDTQKQYPMKITLLPGRSTTFSHLLFFDKQEPDEEDLDEQTSQDGGKIITAEALRLFTLQQITYQFNSTQKSMIFPYMTWSPECNNADPHMIDDQQNYFFIGRPSEIHIPLHPDTFSRTYQGKK